MRMDIEQIKHKILFTLAYHLGKRGVSIEVRRGVIFARHVYKFGDALYLDEVQRFPWGAYAQGLIGQN